MEILTENQGFW